VLTQFTSSTLDMAVLILMLICVLIQLFYFWYFFARLAFLKKKSSYNTNPELAPVSIVICAHNEYRHLLTNIPLILDQQYPSFELIIVNDRSDDGSKELLEDFARNNSRISVINLTQNLNFFKGKKFPLSIGIKSAKYEHLLLTDADCTPASQHWISSMMRNYTPQKEIVIGFSPYKKKSGLLNGLIRFDTLHTAVQYLSMALAGKVYMGVGRNLSYKKTVFLKNKGFITHYDIPSGDDDIFINKVGTARNTAIEISAQSHMVSEPHKHFGTWTRQKRRHLSTGMYYKRATKWLLGMYIGTQSGFYLCVGLLFFTALPIYVPLSLFFIRFISQEIIYIRIAKQLNQSFPWLLLPFAELFFVIFNPILSIYNLFAKPVKWM